MAGQVVTDQAQRLAELIRESKSTVALTGAGISVPSGIPDFRSPGEGLWEKVDPMEVEDLFDDQGGARCSDCSGPVKPDVVLFGELLPADAMAEAESLAAGADLMLCVGSSLEVYPVAGLPTVTLGRGGKIAVITQGPTPFDRDAAVRMDGDVVADLDAV